jgi:hypothetical protein
VRSAWRRGTVLCRIRSDSMSFYHPRKWKYIQVKGLMMVFLKGLFGFRRRSSYPLITCAPLPTI